MSFFLFLLYIFLTFFRPVELYAPELGELRPMLWLWLLAVLTSVGTAISTRTAGARPLHFKLIFAFWALIGVSKMISPWRGATLESLNEFSTSSLLFLLAALNLTTTARIKATLVAVVMAMTCNAVVGINAYHTGENMDLLVLRQNSPAHDEEDPNLPPPEPVTAPATDNSGWYLWRLKSLGFLADPNDFAQVLVMTLPMLWTAYRAGKHTWNLLVIGLPGAAMFYSILLTQSRGALIGTASLLSFTIHKALGTVKTLMLIGTVVAIQMMGAAVGGREFSGKEKSAEERLESWTIGIQLLKGNPITGAGYGNFLEYNYLTAHNSYVLCFAEMGLTGYFVWIGMIVVTFKGLSRTLNLREGTPEAHIAYLLRSSMVGYLTCAWFLSRTYGPALYFLLALGIATWRCATLSMPADKLPAQLGYIEWRESTIKTMVVSILAVYGFVLSHALGGK
ncbi:MAG: O-antigen ligase family protein [Leptothrix sp. (in: b-proteobacteria)]